MYLANSHKILLLFSFLFFLFKYNKYNNTPVVSAWDDACQQLDLYKLDIIGDSFMAAGNLHRRDAEHARKMLRLASEMITLAQGVNVPGNFLSVRVGLSTGSLASGILGRVRRKFTCMGDSVNIAAR